jgi:hypothetical protein
VQVRRIVALRARRSRQTDPFVEPESTNSANRALAQGRERTVGCPKLRHRGALVIADA